MSVRSVSFDDGSDEELCVFSGSDLLLSHYDITDLDWEEVAERALIDERRGLVITQVAVLEDLVDEFLLYLEDPQDARRFREEKLNGKTIGPRLAMLERHLRLAGLLDDEAVDCLAAARTTVDRRNRLAHGTVKRRPTRVVPISTWLMLILRSNGYSSIAGPMRRSGSRLARLRQDVYDAIGAFSGLLAYAESFVERAPTPRHFTGGHYLGAPTP